MAESLLWAAFDALWAGSAVALYLLCIAPQLRWGRASPLAFLVAGALAGAVLVSMVLVHFLAIPSLLITALLMLLIALWLVPGALIQATGGPRPRAPEVEAVFSKVAEAWDRFDVGDIDGAAETVGALDPLRTPATDRYIDLWQRFVREEQARRSGTRESSKATWSAIRVEGDGLTVLGSPLGPRAEWALVGLAAIIGASPTLVAGLVSSTAM